MADDGSGAAPTDRPETRVPMSAALSSAGANMRFARHAQLLDRWPVLNEPWARAIEEHRLGAVDHTPGPASFGR